MAQNNPADRGFDLEMERLLQEHFDAEAPNLSAPGDPWQWLESRMNEPPPTSFFSRLATRLGPVGVNPAAVGLVGASVIVVLGVWVALAWIIEDGKFDARNLMLDDYVGPEQWEALGERLSRSRSRSTSAPTPAPTPSARSAPVGAPSAARALAPTTGKGLAAPPGTTFQDYRRQPFVDASEDNVSTFSLDTDHTSFHLALNWARSGYEVDPASVRAEEWLNAFDYEYEPPSRGGIFGIVGNLYPHPLEGDRHLARIAFQAPKLADDKPLNVTLVLDASGSMSDGNRVAIARAAAEAIRQSLRPQDRIAVIQFTTHVLPEYTVKHTQPDDDKAKASILGLQPHASTNVQAGLDQGVRLADGARNARPDAYNYIILMSDGVANVEATEPFAILEKAYDTDAQNPLRLITVGVGINNYNDVLLEQLAQHGNGWYRYLDSTAQAQATFSRDNWLALSIPFADQTRAQVTWDTETVQRWRIIGYENRVTPDETFTENRKEFSEIYSGAATTVLYELKLTRAARSRSDVPLGRVELRWVDPDSGDSVSQTARLSGNSPGGFRGQEGALARFGAIVALSADLYGSLTNDFDYVSREVHAGLSELLEDLRSLRGELGLRDSYNDFLFLLEHLVMTTEEMQKRATPAVPTIPSGYSR